MTGHHHGDHVNSAIFVNIRGIRYRLSQEALERATCYYGTFAAKFDSSNANFDKQTGEFYYDRNPWLFAYIWDYFATGESHFPREVCLKGLKRELDFWGLDDDIFGGCCWDRLQQHRESENDREELKAQWHKYDAVNKDYSNKGGCINSERRHKVWLFLEYPDSSKAAKAWSIFMLLVVLLSVFLVILSTCDGFRYDIEESHLNNTEHTRFTWLMNTAPYPVMQYMEGLMTLILSLDFVLRLFFCDSKNKFFTSALVWLDLLGLLPIWYLVITLVIMQEDLRGAGDALKTTVIVFSFLRAIRVVKILQVVRNCKQMRLIWLTVKRGKWEMLLLTMMLAIAALIFGHLIFFAEIMEGTILSIYDGIWWALVTMTTLGYGDLYPVSLWGRLVGAWCTLTGIILVALPIPIVINNFATLLYETQAFRRLANRHKRRMSRVPSCGLNTTTETTVAEDDSNYL